MRPYHPADGGVRFSADPTEVAIKKQVKEILEAMESEGDFRKLYPGLRCPKCGSQLAHTRLHGYRCMRGCQNG